LYREIHPSRPQHLFPALRTGRRARRHDCLRNLDLEITAQAACQIILMPQRLVLDTNVWLDWLVFRDPGIVPLQSAVESGAAVILVNEVCAAELMRVLGYPMQKWTLDAAGQVECLARCLAVARMTVTSVDSPLPQCADPDDQKFLELAAAARAHCLLSKDRALLVLAKHRPPLPFRILTPAGFGENAE
jgi:putative PIN family toxin of toxin-antitoxin system